MIPFLAVLGLGLSLPQLPTATASVDRTDVLVGEMVTLTIAVTSEGTVPVRIHDPELKGLEPRGTRDLTRVTMQDGQPQRTVTRIIRLLAMVPGVARIGPIKVEREGATVQTAPIEIDVGGGASAPTALLPTALQAAVDARRPPAGGEGVVVEVLALPSRVVLGEQLDLVTLAWFPRSIRQQLRTPPTLAPPDVQGVWAYQQTTSTGVAASRRVGQDWYDLYVSHQVVFPLSTGTVAVGRATVSYVQPLSYSFLSRELQHEVQSESVLVAVEPQPAEGRPAAFSGAAGRDLSVGLTTSATALTPGAAATVEVVVQGGGNVALWPEPEVEWPTGLRVYPADVDIETDLEDGRIAGVKRFRYLVIADSGGAHLVPGLSYPYFDTDRRQYTVASAPGLRLVAPPGTLAGPARPIPHPLLAREAPSIAQWLDRLAAWVWLVVLWAPPLLVGVVTVARRLRTRRARPVPGGDRDTRALEELDRRLRAALARRMGETADREGPALVAALRAAGVEPSLAVHVTRVRDRLQQAVYGPPGGSDPEELAAEVQEVLRALTGEVPGSERRQLVQAVLVLALCCWAGGVTAQGPRPEDLYAAGAFRTAADSFAQRVEREPWVAAYWYDLGAAFYRLGEDGRARAAWLRAGRLAPRDHTIRQALTLLPPDPVGDAVAPVYRFRPMELAGLGAVLWVVAWLALVRPGSRRIGVALLVVALALGATGAWTWHRYRMPAAIVLGDGVALRDAPYGSAKPLRQLAAGDAVRVLRRLGPWLLVERDRSPGWVLIGEVARL